MHPAWLIATDILLVAASLAFVVWFRGADVAAPLLQRFGLAPGPGLGGWDRNESALVLFQVATLLPVLHALGAYATTDRPKAWPILVATVASLGALSAILIILGITVPRFTLLLDYAVIGGAFYVSHVFLQVRWRRAHERSGPLRLVCIGDVAVVPGSRRLVTTLQEGTFDERRLRDAGHADRWPEVFPVDLEHIDQVLDATMPEEILLGSASEAMRKRVLTYAELHGVAVAAPLPLPVGGPLPRPRRLGEAWVLDLHAVPMRRVGWMAKRALDMVGAVVGLVVFAPVVLAAAIAIKAEDRRLPVFYGGQRVGLKGHRFKMWKLNTMRLDAQDIERSLEEQNERKGPWFKLDQDADPRLTRVGRFLRRYSLNEIPQFWNILVGDMSLVGPRPPTPEEVATYVEYDTRYFQCLDVKPGLTGLWQVTAKNDPSFDRRIELDVEYIRNWSFGLDIRILLKTFLSVLRDTE